MSGINSCPKCGDTLELDEGVFFCNEESCLWAINARIWIADNEPDDNKD
jgi:hypothetical protein|tara:strand:+ start:665 stop:811 length:147 start_codon:yes stop_codon:yes gene_type:complete